MSRARTFTPELLASGRYRYEETDESVASIAADFDVHPQTFHRYVREWGWRRRKNRPPIDLSPAARLLAEAEAAAPLAHDSVADRSAPQPDAPAPAPAETAPPAILPLIERLHAAVEKELGVIERMRAHLGATPQEAAEAERTARTLATLARTLREAQRLRGAGEPPAGHDDNDDDMPTDIEEFRRALARRMEAFVASRTNGSLRVAGGPALDDEAGE